MPSGDARSISAHRAAPRARRRARLTVGCLAIFVLLCISQARSQARSQASSPASSTAGLAAQDDGWVEIVSPHFTVISDASERDARRVAREFEVIRAVFQTALPDLVSEPRRRLTILAVKNQTGLDALIPHFRDSGSRLVGVFLEGAIEHFIVLRIDASRREGFKPIYHEYFHLLTSLNIGRLPTWLMEGLAEVYANTAVRGDTAEVGDVRRDHIDFLAGYRMLPLVTLLSDDTNPHDGDPSLFYAQSWALTHYLLLGDQSGRGARALTDYIARMMRGEDAREAFEASVGPLGDTERALARYVRRAGFIGMRVDAPPDIDPSRFSARRLSPTEARVAHARVLSHGGHTQLARPMLAEALDADPASPLSHEAMGLLEWYEGHDDEAGLAFAEAVRLGSTSYISHYLDARLAGGVSVSVSPTADAARQEGGLQRTLALNSRYAPAYADLAALIAAVPTAREEAQRLAHTATSLEPTAPTHWTVLGDVLLRANRPAEARAAVERGLASVRAPEDRAILTGFLDSLDGARAHYLRGNTLRAGGDIGGAIDAYRVAIGLAPDDVAAHNGLGIALRELGDLDRAVEAFRTAIRFAPASAAAHHNLANTLHAQDALAAAVAGYRDAIALDPKLPGTHRALGDALREQGEREAAIEAYLQAVEVDPEDVAARRSLAALLARLPSDR